MPFLYWSPLEYDAEYCTRASYSQIKVPPDVMIPVLDRDAWDFYPKHQHLYNKLLVNYSSGVECNLIGASKLPAKYPVIVRPVYNLFGMGHGARIINSQRELLQLDLSGYFWAEKLNGSHYSWDIAVIDGTPVWQVSWRGVPHESRNPGVMSRWSTEDAHPNVRRAVLSWVEIHLPGYTGLVNIETIGGKIIEVHLRAGDIIYSANAKLMDSVVSLYSKSSWTYEEKLPEFHMVPIWIPSNFAQNLDLSSETYTVILKTIEKYCDSWCIEFNDDWPGEPFGLNRVMYLGFSSLKNAKICKSKIYKIIEAMSYKADTTHA